LNRSKKNKEIRKENDELVRKIVRRRGVCEKCGKRLAKAKGEGELGDVDHAFGKDTDGLRWLLDNLLYLCTRCHRLIKHSNAGRNTEKEFRVWFIEKYPEKYEKIKQVMYRVNIVNPYEVNEMLKRCCDSDDSRHSSNQQKYS